MNHLLKRLVFSALVFLLSGAVLAPLAREAFQHNAKPDAGVPTDLVASYDFDAANAANGKKVWALERMRVYKCYWRYDEEEEAEYNIRVNLNEAGGSLTVEPWKGNDAFTSKFRLPGKTVASPKDFRIFTINSDYERIFHQSPKNGKSRGPGAISVTPSTETEGELYNEDYQLKVMLGTEATINGESVRVHDLSGKVPAMEFGATFRVSLFNAYYGIDLDYVVPQPGRTVQVESTKAETNPGEDKGKDIDPEVFTTPKDDDDDLTETVVVSVGGALIGAGLIGASRGGNKKGGKKKNDKNKNEEKKAAPTYKMYVYKGFGDAIQRGAAPVKVYARIAQVVEGKEYGCPELTAKIQASGTHLTVKPIGIENGYLCAEVSAAVDEAAEEAEVIFTLAGAGGMFVRKIIFRLTGNPEIKFPALSEDGENWLMDAELDTVEMIAGGRGRDRLRFVFQDAATEPTDIRFLNTDGFDITYEKDAGKAFTYYACIQNRTMLIPKESKVFADPVARTITIEATFSGKLKVRGQFTINLYPEGLFVFIIPDDPEWRYNARLCRRSQGLPEILVQGRMEVVSWKKPRLNGIVDEEIPPLFFVPCYAYEKADGRTVVVRESRCFSAGKFQPTDTATGNILAKYRCKIGPIGEKAFCIQPQDILVEGDDAPYHVTLPFSVRHDGRSARADIPIRLVGEPIDTTMVEWEKEYKNLQRRIIQFSVPEDIDMWIRLLKERATEPRCSVEDLHLVSRQIVAVYVDYWTKQREADYAEMARADNALTRWEWVKFIGDCAFSYLVNAFAGPLADAIITPAKDIFFYSLGELYACDQHGTKFDWKNLEIVKSLNDAGDNVAANMMVDGVKANIKNAKMIAVYIAGYYVIAVFRNYSAKMAEEGVSDWYGAFKDAFKDLSVNAFKAIAAELFMTWLKSKNFRKNISKTLQKYLNKQFKARFKQKYPTYNIDFNSKGITITRTGTGVFKVKAGPNVEKTSAAECVTKFLSELFGRGWGYVHEGVYDWAEHKARTSQLFFNEHGQLVFCFRLWEGEGLRPLYCELVLQKVILYSENPLGFFAYLYEMFFGSLIGAPAITFPKDPPFKRYDKKVWEEEYRHNHISSKYPNLMPKSKSRARTGDSSAAPGEA